MNETPNKSSPIQLDLWDFIFALACFISSLALYIRTLTPGLLPGDSGEFQTLAYLLGHTHPTGYPVYLIFAKLATLIPLGDVAYRVNLFSGIMGALAVAAVYLSGRLLVKYHFLAFIGAAALAVAPTFWSQAIIAEIYSTGSALLALILLTLLWWDQGNNNRVLIIAGFLGGLSLGVHMSVALLAPAVLLFLLLNWRRGAKMWAYALVGAASGLMITIAIFWLIDLHNPTTSYFNAVVEPSRSSWGLTADEIDGPLERLLFGWSARQFRTFMFADISNVMLTQAISYWDHLSAELSWVLVSLSVIGAVALLVNRWRVGILYLTALFVQLFFFFNYQIWDLYVFYIPSYVLLTTLAVPGMGILADLATPILRITSLQAHSRWSNLVLEISVTLLVLGLTVWPTFRPHQNSLATGDIDFNFDDFPVFDEHLQEIAHATVVNLPEDAILFTDWNMIWPYYYTAFIMEDRSDLAFIETRPADDVDDLADTVIEYVAERISDQPIYFSLREPTLSEAGFTFTPARIGPTRLFHLEAKQ